MRAHVQCPVLYMKSERVCYTNVRSIRADPQSDAIEDGKRGAPKNERFANIRISLSGFLKKRWRVTLTHEPIFFAK